MVNGSRFALSLALLTVSPVYSLAEPDDTFLATARLRGGFDANPTLVPGGPSSAFVGFDSVAAGSRTGEHTSVGFTAEVSEIRYADRDIAPLQREKISFVVGNKPAADELSLRATTAVSRLWKYDTRAAEASQSLRAEIDGKATRFFITGDVKAAELNETNGIYPDFLPTPHRFVRATMIPGMAVKAGEAEIGTSVNLSATKYTEEFDVFGFARDNTRFQPFVFFKYANKDLQLFANVSHLYGRWSDVDFSDVSRTLFEVSAKYSFKPFSFELGVERAAADTTFPLSPIVIVTAASATLRTKFTEKTSGAVALRLAETEYPDTPFTARAASLGFELSHEMSPGWFVGAELNLISAQRIVGDHVTGSMLSFFVMHRLQPESKTGRTPSRARPVLLVRPG